MDVTVTGRPSIVVSSLVAALSNDRDGWTVRLADADDLTPPDDARPDAVVVVGTGRGVPMQIDAAGRRYPGVGVVWLAGRPSGREVADAVSRGCTCVVSEDGTVDDVVTGVCHAADGRAWTTPDLVDTVMTFIRTPTSEPSGELTARELEVLDLLRSGHSTREISERLVISLHTTKNHVRRILAKLQVHSRLEAVAVAEGRRLFGA